MNNNNKNNKQQKVGVLQMRNDSYIRRKESERMVSPLTLSKSPLQRVNNYQRSPVPISRSPVTITRSPMNHTSHNITHSTHNINTHNTHSTQSIHYKSPIRVVPTNQQQNQSPIVIQRSVSPVPINISYFHIFYFYFYLEKHNQFKTNQMNKIK